MSQLAVIANKIRSKEAISKVTMALGFDAQDESGRNEAYRYAASALAEIEKTAGDPKRDLTVCNPDSIVQTMIDAAKFQFMIDGRQLAHIVKYGNKATLQIGYRGYIAKISQYYKDVDYSVGAIYEGDTLTVDDQDGFQSYKVTKKDPFNDDPKQLKGVYVALSYSKDGRKYQKVTVLSKNEITKIRGKAKQDYVWSEWLIEKALVAAIKRNSKIHFATIQGLQEMIRYDNESHFEIDKPAPPTSAGNIVDNLNASLAQESGEKPIDAEVIPETVDEEEIPFAELEEKDIMK